MITRFPGTCSCGCRRAYSAGASVERQGASWVLASCVARARPGPLQATTLEVLDTLARARAVAARVYATTDGPEACP